MWLARILGKVTSADRVAHGMRARRNKIRNFKRRLVETMVPEAFAVSCICKNSGNSKIAE
jgi:hypothetical protein